MLELIKAIEAIRFDSNARVIILRSTTPGIFCAGADLKVSLPGSPLQLNFKEKVALFKMIIYKDMFMQNLILKYSPFLQISSFSVIHKVF